jgi:hypothetical protein
VSSVYATFNVAQDLYLRNVYVYKFNPHVRSTLNTDY